MNKGVLYSASAYLLWGLLPIYWKLIKHVPSQEILLHRMVWSFVFCLILLSLKGNWAWIQKLATNKWQILASLGSAAILAVNWMTYIWAVNHGFIVEASLGYFINPMINILIGVIFLQERLRKGQIGAISLAACGVLYLTIMYGSFPWIALTLAFTFGFYGLVRKISSLESIEGLCVETGFQTLPAAAIILFWQTNGTSSFFTVNSFTSIMMIGAGAATAMPLILFAAGARKVTMTTLGILQYLAPTLQFLIGVLVYNEAFSGDRAVGFIIVWIALAIYTAELLLHSKKMHAKKTR